MKIRFIVEDDNQLKKLEDAMKNMPCILLPQDNSLEIKLSMGEKTVIITPEYYHVPISKVRGQMNAEFRLDYDSQNPDNSRLVLQAKGYSYLINLRRGK